MGFGKTKKRIAYALIINFIFIVNCSKNKDDSILLNYKIINSIDIYLENYYGEISGVNDNSIFLWRNNKLLTEINLKSNEITTIGTVGEAPGEYLCPCYTLIYKNNYYITDAGSNKIIIFDSTGCFVDEIRRIHGRIGIFKNLNDTLIFYTNTSTLVNFFCLYNVNDEENVFSFGEAIDYPVERDREKLIFDGKIIALSDQWDIKDSLLIWYDYYNNRFRVYNLFGGNILTSFGRDFHSWKTPPIFEIPGDQYHSSRCTVSSSPLVKVLISDKYIFACFGMIWKFNWWLRDFDENKKMNILKNKYYFIDVYSRENFNYLGTIYPLDDYIYYENLRLVIREMSLENDTIINFYLQDIEDGSFFRKVVVSVNMKDTVIN